MNKFIIGGFILSLVSAATGRVTKRQIGETKMKTIFASLIFLSSTASLPEIRE
jgi:hypothetical protein